MGKVDQNKSDGILIKMIAVHTLVSMGNKTKGSPCFSNLL